MFFIITIANIENFSILCKQIIEYILSFVDFVKLKR